MRDKEIKKSNPAIDKVESIAGDKKQTAVETVFEKADGVVVDNTTKISVDNNKLNNLKKKRAKIIDYSVYHSAKQTVEDNRSCNGKNLCPKA